MRSHLRIEAHEVSASKDFALMLSQWPAQIEQFAGSTKNRCR